MQLLEISHPDFPLLQIFLRNAPGTYQHSLQSGEPGGAGRGKSRRGSGSLTRVGSLFHDIGKSVDAVILHREPGAGQSQHACGYYSRTSREKIIQHVHDGVALAHKYRLPHRIDDFILEHHGTMVTRYQYNQALEKAGGDASKVDMEQFRYPGPRPVFARKPPS